MARNVEQLAREDFGGMHMTILVLRAENERLAEENAQLLGRVAKNVPATEVRMPGETVKAGPGLRRATPRPLVTKEPTRADV